MQDKIESRRRDDDPLNDPTAKEARRIFLSGAFAGGIVPAIMDNISQGIKEKTATGTDVLNQQLSRIWRMEGAPAMRAQALDLGRKFKELYFPKDEANPDYLPRLPKELQAPAVLTYDDALATLDKMTIPQMLKRQYYLKIREAFIVPFRPSTFVPPGGKR